MPAPSSLEWAVEQFGIEQCRKHPMLKAIRMAHEDEDDQSDSDCVIFKALKGVDRLDGPKGNDVELEITCRSSEASASENESISNAVDECFKTPYAMRDDNVVKGLFDYLRIEDEKSQDRNNSKSLRKRTRRIPFVARLKGSGSTKLI